MVNIDALVASAKKKLEHGEAIYRVDAARKAVKGAGIFDKSDIERLVKQILPQLPRNWRRAA